MWQSGQWGKHGGQYSPSAYQEAINANIASRAYAKRRRLWLEEGEDRKALIAALDKAVDEKPNSFLAKMMAAYDEWGKLSPGQEAACRKILAEAPARAAAAQAARKAEGAVSEWVGEIGERKVFDLEVRFIVSLESQYGLMHIHGFKDSDGNVLIHKGVSLGLAKGQKVRVKASIKSHDLYEGVKQSRIARPVVLEEGA